MPDATHLLPIYLLFQSEEQRDYGSDKAQLGGLIGQRSARAERTQRQR